MNTSINYTQIFGFGQGYLVTDDSAPVDPATVTPCLPPPCPRIETITVVREEVPPATEAAEGTCTCHQP